MRQSFLIGQKMETRTIKNNLIQLIDFYFIQFGVKDQLPRFLVVGFLGIWVDCLSFFLIFHYFISDILTAQVFSFTIAVTHNFILNKYWTFKVKDGKKAPTQYLKFFLVALFALSLRSGVIAQCLQYGVPPLLSLLIGIGSGTVINFLGSREWAFSEREGYPNKITSDFLIWAFIFFLFLIRLVYAALIDLSPEEAYYWNYAIHPAPSYFDHPPMVAWIIWIGTFLLGNTEIGVRIGGIFLAIGSTYLIYLLGKMWFGKKSGILAALLFQIIPIYFVYGVAITPDVPLIFFWLLTLSIISMTLFKEKPWGWYIAGVTLGCSMLSKYTGILLVPATFFFLILNREYRNWLFRKEPYIALLISALLFSPVAIWNYHHHWASFNFQFYQRLQESTSHPILNFLEFLGCQIGVLFPTFFFGLFFILLVSFWLSIKNRSPKWKLSFLFSFPVLVILILFSLRSEVKINWILPGYLSLFFAAYPCYRYIRLKTKGKLKIIVQKTVTSSIYLMPVIFLFICYHLGIGISLIPPVYKLTGWKELGLAVKNEENAMEEKTGKDPFIIGKDKYSIASELAFYTDEPYDTFSENLLGSKGLAFEYWTKNNLQHRDALVVSKHFPKLEILKKYFERVDERVKKVQLFRKRRFIKSFYLVRCYNYIGKRWKSKNCQARFFNF
jgi:dolichol-phosphate mannosyltransferase